MRWILLLLLLLMAFPNIGESCTIVAVSGRVTDNGRPLLLKNRDSNSPNIQIKINSGNRFVFLCQCNVNTSTALSGFNEVGFAIVSSHSYNMPNSESGWNAYIMQLALGRCATVDEFEHFLDSLPKPMPVCANYGVIDAQGHAAVYETNAFSFVKYDADSVNCGYVVRTGYSMSGDTTGIATSMLVSWSRFRAASNYLDETILLNGVVSKDYLFGLTRCLVSADGIDLKDYAPYDEYSAMPEVFISYVPRYTSTSAMVVQGVLPDETPSLTTAWTMVGPPMATVTIPLWITIDKILPQKTVRGGDGYSWLSHQGQQLKQKIFINSTTIDLAKLYNLSSSGIMQKICRIEEEILFQGDGLLDRMRRDGFSDNDIATYYAWVDDYLEKQYIKYFYNSIPMNSINNVMDELEEPETECYDLFDRQIKNAPDNGVIEKIGKKAIILN